jgi:hypothetical protein
MENEPKVPGEPIGEVTKDVTPAGGVAVNATPSAAPVDAGSQLDALKVEYEAKLRAYQDDLNHMKSSFQRKEAERERDWTQRREDYEREVERLKLSTMDEDQRKQYESESTVRRMTELENQLRNMAEEKSNYESMLRAQNYFIARGVPANELSLDEGYEALWNSGMAWIDKDYTRLKQLASNPPVQPVTPQKPPEAPPVVTTTNSPAYAGTRWKELVKEYGSEEAVYQGVEHGQIDPSVIPVPPGN